MSAWLHGTSLLYPLSGVISIASGYFHSIALLSNKTMQIWGNNYHGQLGNSSTFDSNTPIQVSSLSDVTYIAGGWDHTLALKSDGTVWAWGYNTPGQLGDGTMIDRHVPIQVLNLCSVALSIENSIDNLDGLNVYPNPNSGIFTIEIRNQKTGEIKVMNVLGKVIYQTTTHNSKSEINISNSSAGIYLVQVEINFRI